MVTDKINLYKFIFKSQILFTKHHTCPNNFQNGVIF